MPKWRYVLFVQSNTQPGGLEIVQMPESFAYQLSALNKRLHKEIEKLTASDIPQLPVVVAETSDIELVHEEYKIIGGLDYINELERNFSSIREDNYPLISLLTEIRALQAQLEQWYEEEGVDGVAYND